MGGEEAQDTTKIGFFLGGKKEIKEILSRQIKRYK